MVVIGQSQGMKKAVAELSLFAHLFVQIHQCLHYIIVITLPHEMSPWGDPHRSWSIVGHVVGMVISLVLITNLLKVSS